MKKENYIKVVNDVVQRMERHADVGETGRRIFRPVG